MTTTRNTSDSVTLDYRNQTMWGYCWFPRWIRVRLIARKGDTGRACVAEDSWRSDSELEVTLHRCACGAEFACYEGYRGGCKACDQRARAETQRKRRLAGRLAEMPEHCAYCGGGLDARRRTRRYCSGACRTAAMRDREKAASAA